MNRHREIFAAAVLFIAALAYFTRPTPQSPSAPPVKTKSVPIVEIETPKARLESHPASENDLQFESELTAVSRALPRTENLNRLSDSQLHHTPRAITEGAMRVGTIAEKASADARLVPQAVRFYVDCASRSEVEITVRSICYSKLRRLERRYNLPNTPGSEAIPTSVMRVADDGLEK